MVAIAQRVPLIDYFIQVRHARPGPLHAPALNATEELQAPALARPRADRPFTGPIDLHAAIRTVVLTNPAYAGWHLSGFRATSQFGVTVAFTGQADAPHHAWLVASYGPWRLVEVCDVAGACLLAVDVALLRCFSFATGHVLRQAQLPTCRRPADLPTCRTPAVDVKGVYLVNVVLFFAGLGKKGGISPDVHHLADALGEVGIDPKVTCRFMDLLGSRGGAGTIVNVYGCLPSAKSIGAMLLARARGQRLVWTPVFHPRRCTTWKGSGPYRVMALFDRLAPRLARITHGISAATEEEAAFFSAMGAPRADVIPLVVSETHRRLEGSDRRDARRRFGAGDGPIVLMIAAHSPRRKGMDFARDVLAELHRHFRRSPFSS